ncbi:MAG: hypothetical protein AAF502_16755 [Bacteroidota bacterium]
MKNEYRPISIWQPEIKNGQLVFCRPPVLPLGDHYADQLEIKAQKEPGTIRVCYFGESAAAGYLYAPVVTPAKLLQHQMNALTGNGQFEIIDLSRTNEQLETMLDTIEASLQLRPNYFVMFTGNNWNLLETPGVSTFAKNKADKQQFAKLLKENGIIGPIEFAAREIVEKASSVFEKIGRLAKANDVQVVCVVPEVNLADWENIQPPVNLGQPQISEWYTLMEKASNALFGETHDIPETHLQKMTGIDDLLCPTTFRLFGKLAIANNDEATAVKMLRYEVSTTAYSAMAFLAAPQADLRVQEFLRRTAERLNFDLVDLPAMFEVHTGCRIPGRKLFLDYCHLTLEGMKVAMAGVAEHLITHSGNGGKNWSIILGEVRLPPISKAQKALTKFATAIHNAHRLLSIKGKKEILSYWCQLAIEDDPGIKAVMESYVRIRLSETPATMNKFQLENFESEYRLLTQHGLQYDYLDADLVEVIEELVDKPLITAPLPKRYNRHPAYRLWEPLFQFFPNLMEKSGQRTRAYLKCPWPETVFCFYADGKSSVRITLVLRLPACDSVGQMEARFLVNDALISQLAIGNKWAKVVIEVVPSFQKTGLNKLTVCWPLPGDMSESKLSDICGKLERGFDVDLHLVFGEVFELQVD